MVQILKKVMKWFFVILMLVNGVFYATNIVVIGNTNAILNMHEDLAPNAGAVIANIKVINIFIVGLLFVICAVSIIRKKYKFAITGIIAAVLFFAMGTFILLIQFIIR